MRRTHMFRLVSFADGKPGDDILTTYISAIASGTIAEGPEFFYGISYRYITTAVRYLRRVRL